MFHAIVHNLYVLWLVVGVACCLYVSDKMFPFYKQGLCFLMRGVWNRWGKRIQLLMGGKLERIKGYFMVSILQLCIVNKHTLYPCFGNEYIKRGKFVTVQTDALFIYFIILSVNVRVFPYISPLHFTDYSAILKLFTRKISTQFSMDE